MTLIPMKFSVTFLLLFMEKKTEIINQIQTNHKLHTILH